MQVLRGGEEENWQPSCVHMHAPCQNAQTTNCYGAVQPVHMYQKLETSSTHACAQHYLHLHLHLQLSVAVGICSAGHVLHVEKGESERRKEKTADAWPHSSRTRQAEFEAHAIARPDCTFSNKNKNQPLEHGAQPEFQRAAVTSYNSAA